MQRGSLCAVEVDRASIPGSAELAFTCPEAEQLYGIGYQKEFYINLAGQAICLSVLILVYLYVCTNNISNPIFFQTFLLGH